MEGGDFRMSSIDQRVVHMTFDNRQFQEGIASTLASLQKLDQSLKLQNATKGLKDVDSAAKGVSLKGIADGVESVTAKFGKLSTIGTTALATITSKAVMAGGQMLKALTLDPVMAGFHNYETQINAVGTILANTGLEGSKGLAKVNKALDELNTYANQTVYNFSDMAKNIGTFTAAGVGLQTSVNSIKGIANLAAISGSTSEQASTAMYQLSQAIATGTVHLMDWNSVVNAGMGGKVFQTALINTARASGVAIDSIIKKSGSFRDSLQKGWLTSKILTQTLSQFTGDLSLKQIQAMGFTKKQAEEVLKLGKTGVDAATKIKTATQLTDALKEEVATAWSTIFKTIFGNINQATTLFTGIHKVAESALTAPIYKLNELVKGWDKLGGRKVLIQGLSDAMHVLGSVLHAIGSAFREVFPPTTAKDLYDMTVSFRDFMERLKMGGQTADELKRTFAGVFAVLKIGWDIIKAVGTAFFSLFGAVSGGSGGFLKITASIGDFLVKLEKAINKSMVFKSFFGTLAAVLAVPIQLLQMLGLAVGQLFDKFDGNKATTGLSNVSKQFQSMNKYSHAAVAIWDGMVSALKTVGSYVDKVWQKISGFFKNLGTGGTATSNDFNLLLASLQTGLFAGILLIVRKLVKYFTSGGSHGPIRSIVEAIREPFEELTNTLKTMQSVLKAATLLEIAAAVLLLAIAMSKLSKIDAGGLTRASIAISVMFGQLLGSMAIFQKFIGTAGFAKLPFMMLSLIELAGAVTILAKAVTMLAQLDWNGLAKGLTGLAATMAILAGGLKLIGNPKDIILTGFGLTEVAGAIGGLVAAVIALSKLDWNGLAKGLTGLGVTLAALGLFAKFAEGSGAGAIRTVGLILLATAIKILVSAVKDFAGLSWENISKGLTGVAALLASLALYTKFSKANAAGIAQGVGIVLLASAIKILVSAVKDFQGVSWENIAKGLVGVGVMLGSLMLFTKFSKADATAPLQGLGLILLATAIRILVDAVKSFAGMSWEEIAKGLLTLAGALAIITGALMLIPPEAALQALGVLGVAISMGMIASALQVMADMSWEGIAKSLVEMLGAFTIIAAALYVIPPTAPLAAAAILLVALSLGQITDALVKMGGMSWGEIAKSLVELAGSLLIIAAAMIVMTEALPGAAALIVVAAALRILTPALQAMGEMSWEGILKSLVELAGVFTIIGIAGLLLTPAIPTLLALGAAVAIIGLGVLAAGVGLSLFAASLKALGQNVSGFNKDIKKAGPGLVKSIETVIISMTKAVVRETPRIVGALLNMLLQMLNQLNKYVPRLIDAGAKLIVAILNGIAKNIGKIVTAATNVAVNFINGVAKNLPRIIQSGFNLIISFINGLTKAINSNSAALGKAGGNLAVAIIKGMVTGLRAGIGQIVSAAKSIAGSAIDAAKSVLHINSPSKVFIAIGQSVNEGFYKGLMSGDKKKVDKAFDDLRKRIASAMQSSASQIKTLEDRLNRLSKARHKNWSEINKTKSALKEAQKEHKAEAAAYDEVTKKLKKQHTEMDKLTDKYNKVSAAVKKAQDTLANAIKTRDDYNKQIHEQYDNLPKIGADTTVAGFEGDLEKQIEKTKEFMNALQRLRGMGLSDVMYKELLADGIDALPFAQQLLAQGKAGVAHVNDLGKQLDTASTALGKTASDQLYQAGVDSAKGLLKGLQAQQKALEHQMEKLADAMVKAIKKKLHIKSPSRVFAEIGGFSALGLVKGLDEMSGLVQTSAARIGDKAIESLGRSLSGMSDLVTSNVDIRPTITPVLDLSSVKKDASQIGSMLNGQSLSVQSAYSKAANLSAGYMSIQSATDAAATSTPPTEVTFNQYNNSPKALSSADIYRQTNNQLSVAKNALSTNKTKGALTP
jgi:tape measure domain-containing protein